MKYHERGMPIENRPAAKRIRANISLSRHQIKNGYQVTVNEFLLVKYLQQLEELKLKK